MPTRLNRDDFLKKKGNPHLYYAESFNKNTTLTENTKLVIVGTLTPPETPYFYCSFFNRVYGFIDGALAELHRNGERTLKELKRGLTEVHTKKVHIKLLDQEKREKNIKEIINILSKNGIAFLDVMDEALRKENTYLDSDIEYYTLAEKDFKKIKSTPVIIANSRLAEDCCKEMGITPKYLSQRRGSRDSWINAIVDAIK